MEPLVSACLTYEAGVFLLLYGAFFFLFGAFLSIVLLGIFEFHRG